MNIKKITALALCGVIMTAGTAVFAEEETAENNSGAVVTSEEEAKQTDSENLENDKEAGTEDIAAPSEDAPKEEPEEKEPPKADESAGKDGYTVMDSDAVIYFNGEEVKLDTGLKKLVDKNGGATNLVPIRKIAEMLNCTVAWRATDKTIHILKAGTSYRFTVGEPVYVEQEYKTEPEFVYTTNEKAIEYKGGYPIITEEGRTLIPIRAVADCLGADINYVEEKNAIEIKAGNDIIGNKPSIGERIIKDDIEEYNYKPDTEIQTAKVTVTVRTNFGNALPSLCDNVTVTFDGKTEKLVNKTCSFSDVKAGTYKVSAENIPEGYEAKSTDVTVEAGKDIEVIIYINKAATEQNEDAENK